MILQKLQKILAGFLIFCFLLTFVFRVPLEMIFPYSAFAEQREFYNLVSILVDEDTYGEVKSKLVRYSKDIQNALENTKVVILPTPSDASVYDIASLNESLYFEGYKAVDEDVDFESRLVGTVLVGKIPVPVVFMGQDSGKTILPYTDFEDKSFIFSNENKRYEQNNDRVSNVLTPEIWHGVISPNTGDFDSDVSKIEDYFDKNHDFYTGKGVFDENIGAVNATQNTTKDGYEPYVFYYDQFREHEALQYQAYIGYQMYLQNVEDITYNRYSKELAEKVKSQVLDGQNTELQSLINAVDPSFNISAYSDSPDQEVSSDVLTRYITDNATNKYLEIFNGSTLGEMRKYIFNAGRYNSGATQVNMDMPPFLISVLDQVNAQIIKNANQNLENQITEIVKNGLSRNIAIPVQESTNNALVVTKDPDTKKTSTGQLCGTTFSSYYNGKYAGNITSAAQCSIYRGNTNSGTLVEANRAYDLNLSASDAQLCGLGMSYDARSGRITGGLSGVWGGNTPINLLGTGDTLSSALELGSRNTSAAVVPLFDIIGAKESSDATKNPSPLDCFDTSKYILTQNNEAYSYKSGDDTVTGCRTQKDIPLVSKNIKNVKYYTSFSTSGVGGADVGNENSPAGTTSLSRFCASTNTLSNTKNYYDIYDESLSWVNSAPIILGRQCTEKELILNTTSIATETTSVACSSDGGCPPCPQKTTYSYKTIPSYVLHTSPTDEEFGTQIESMFSPSLPIDKNRYIDFIGANGIGNNYGYQRIDFPQLFRVSVDESDLTFETAAEAVKKYLDDISASINQTIESADPDKITDSEAKKIYDQLKVSGEYPDADVDLYGDLTSKTLQIYTLENQTKEISYFDTLVFAVYWNNLKTVSAKYKFIFQNYLSNQFEGNEYAFSLPKAKNFYESSYLAAPGDAQNMYVKMDPEKKSIHPYADIIAQNASLATILSSYDDVENDLDMEYTCAPPEGVNIFQWIPAIICWLKEMLPPKIKISAGQCGPTPLSDEQLAEIQSCSVDRNNNGILDCYEEKLSSGSLLLSSDAARYYYYSVGKLDISVRDNEGEPAFFVNGNPITVSLSQLEIQEDETKALSPENSKLVYDSQNDELNGEDDLESAQKYISFYSTDVNTTQGEASAYFYTRGQDVNAYFEAKFDLSDADGNKILGLQSEKILVQIRGDRMMIHPFVVESPTEYSYGSTISVSGSENICVVDISNSQIEDQLTPTYSLSEAKEKLLFTLKNINTQGVSLGLNFPLRIQIKDSQDALVFSQDGVRAETIDSAFSLFAARESGTYTLEVRDAYGFVAKQEFILQPEVVSDIDVVLGSNVLQTGGNVSSHFLTLTDAFDNIASGKMYTVEAQIDGKSVVFADSNEDTATWTAYEGFLPFRLKTTKKDGLAKLNFTVKDSSGKVLATEQKQISVVDTLKIRAYQKGDAPKVGGGNYQYDIEILDGDENVVSGMNSRMYVSVDNKYASVSKEYFDILSGKGNISFTTKKLAGEDIKMNFTLEGANSLHTASIDILPAKPVYIELSVSKDKIEASPSQSTMLYAQLKDQYFNDVFTDNTTVLTLEIPEQSQSIIRSSDLHKQVKRGQSGFEIFATDVPGIGYFKVSSNPDIGKNTFTIVSQTPFKKDRLVIPGMKDSQGNLSVLGRQFFKDYSQDEFISLFSTLLSLQTSRAYEELSDDLKTQVENFWNETYGYEVSGVGENAGSVETFFFWGKDDVEGNAYNSLYTVLLGAEYGDITQENYLASSLLFDKDNASLAVTSILNNPYKHSDVLGIGSTGKMSLLSYGDISQDIQSEVGVDSDGNMFFDIENAALDTYIGRVYYLLSRDVSTYFELEKEGVEGYNLNTTGDIIQLVNPKGVEIFRLGKDKKIFLKSGVRLTVSENSQSQATFDVYDGEILLGKLLLEGDFDLNVTRDTSGLQEKIDSLSDTLLVHLVSNSYNTRNVYAEDGSMEKRVYYRDPFAQSYALDDLNMSDVTGLEASYDEAGIGWQDNNMFLLSFSAGESVGEASREFQSFSMINLGDPVISLPSVAKKFSGSNEKKSFDSTLGELVTQDPELSSFEFFDYNNDQKTDILGIKSSGYLTLLEGANTDTRFISHGDLAYSADSGADRLVKTGDFTGDGYDDIFFVKLGGKPALFNNVEKDFSEMDVSENFALSGAIIQAESFDMDADGKTDIVTLDDTGELHIFYGGGSSKNPNFSKMKVGDGYGLELTGEKQNFGGAVYFDQLTQINQDSGVRMVQQAQEFLEQYQSELQAYREAQARGEDYELPEPEFVNESVLESLIYEGIEYVPENYETRNVDESYVSDVLESQSGSLVSDFLSSYNDYISYVGTVSERNQVTYFLRSQYAHTLDLKIEKSFHDTSSGTLQTGDSVLYSVKLKNDSSSRKTNMVYVDSIPEYFSFSNEKYSRISAGNTSQEDRKEGIGNYNIFVDDFSLDPGEEIEFQFELTTLPLSYGFIQVGKYENGEVGDDAYGDIILKEDEKNCGKQARIFRSTAARSYTEGLTTPSCDMDAVDVGNTFPEVKDENDNGIPDYLETLLTQDVNGNVVVNDAQSNSGNLVNYATGALEDLYVDTDLDGIPDSDDSMDNTDDGGDFMDAINQLNGAIDDISGEIDTIIQGLSCGFGGGACFANPLNWAPLAPGSVPTLFGYPLGMLTPTTGVPIFSGLTGQAVPLPHGGCVEVPSVYPANVFTFDGACFGPPSAGGTLGTIAPTNFVRMFVTPTLTGGVGVAVCFGGPAIAAGYSNPMGVHPIVPGGNCVVAAMPLIGCKEDAGDPSGLGYPYVDGVGVIHANCDGTPSNFTSPVELSREFVTQYFTYLETGEMPEGMYENYVDTFSDIDEYSETQFTPGNQPLITIGDASSSSLMSSSVDLDFSALKNGGSLGDVVQIHNKRVGGFPNFLMDWVERQIDEIASKLTNLPKIYVVLPDFGGAFEGGFEKFDEKLSQNAKEKEEEKTDEKTKQAQAMETLRAQKKSLDCTGKDKLECAKLDLNIASLSGENFMSSTSKKLSSISQVYEYLGNIPFVEIKPQTFTVSIPWIEQTDFLGQVADMEFMLQEYKSEFESAKTQWTGAVKPCTGSGTVYDSCIANQKIAQNALAEIGQFIASINNLLSSLQAIKEYPEKIEELLHFKEKYLEQILCNIEAISSLMGEWIAVNGERFKTWVELYVLIKAILKSWQLFIDIFNGYDAECHQCKNERQDLQTFIFRLISMVIPSPPIIEFPKWPDIVLDLHNIRMGITVYLPEIKLSTRPILLPTLPKLTLPNFPSLDLNLPRLPSISLPEIPELPDLPTLPKIDLPDLPPAPTIPKLFGAVEIVLNIAKLVTKVMCILKMSPFVPEWRAGDQIAFLTERNGYLPLDFIDLQPPAFSFSALSAIKVMSYVNADIKTEFLLEAMRAVLAPIDEFSNNIANMFNIQVSDLDFSDLTPSEINIDVEDDGSVDTSVSYDVQKRLSLLAGILSYGIMNNLKHAHEDKGKMMTNQEFTHYMNTTLSQKKYVEDGNLDELRNLWASVQQRETSKEDALIQKLQESRIQKFDTLENIIQTEQQIHKKQTQDISKILSGKAYENVAQMDDTRFDAYNKQLESFNISTLEAAQKLLEGESQESKEFRETLDSSAKDLMREVKTGLSAYKSKLIAQETGTTINTERNSCISDDIVQYEYEGIYVLEDGKNYKLFDYTDILSGKEVPKIQDIDADGDNDIFYLVDGKLFFKENRKQSPEKKFVTTNPIIVSSGNNPFYSGEKYLSALDGFSTSSVADGMIQAEFKNPKREDVHIFRLAYHTIVDRYLNLSESFIPKEVETHRIDGISDIENRIPEKQSSDYSLWKNLAILKYAGNIGNTKLTQKRLYNIADDIAAGKNVTITRDTLLYTGKSSAQIQYLDAYKNEKEVSLPAGTSLAFQSSVTILEVQGNVYVEGEILGDIRGEALYDFVGMPILPGAIIQREGNILGFDHSSHIDIEYYDGTKSYLDMRNIKFYSLYDLGSSLRDTYSIKQNVENDFYYAKVSALQEDIQGTLSQQQLLSPQTAGDNFAPQFGFNQKIRIPVYQKRQVDFTDYIYEDGGLGGIQDVWIDFDTSSDSDGDGNPENDRDQEKMEIIFNAAQVSVKFGPFDTIFEKTIRVFLKDDNNNISSKDITLEVYAPTPSIENVEEYKILGALEEVIANEPVRIYRYRGGQVVRLENTQGNSVSLTDESANYNFDIQNQADGLLLTQSGTTLAKINEYTGVIQLQNENLQIQVLPSNNPQNESAFPEIVLLQNGTDLFQQHVLIPKSEPKIIESGNQLDAEGMYLKIIDQENYGNYKVPLSVNYNPGSVILYKNSDNDKTPILTVFQDGRITLNESEYKLVYQNFNDILSFMFVQKSTGKEIAQIFYKIDASYIINQ